MNDVVVTFPLLCLPKNAILNTLEVMKNPQIFGVFLLSKKTKSIVESLKLTTRRFIVSISDPIRIQLLFPIDGRDHLYLELSQFEENYSSEGLGTPGNVHCDFENTSVEWRNSMSAKQLLDHLLFIFHGSITSLYFYSNCVRLSLDSVHKYVKDVKSIHILSRNREHTGKILSLFHPAAFDINYSTLIDRVPGDVLIQNLDHIRVLHAQITLNDLLITNARSIRFEHFKISARILNKFLKMFAKGSNQRLEFMLLVFRHTAIQPGELLSGLKYENAPHGIWRCFKTVDERKIWDVAEGWDISRFDGVKATINLNRQNGSRVTQPLFYQVVSPSFVPIFCHHGRHRRLNIPVTTLPINAILNTFRTMDPVQVFGVSILSKKAKNLVESFKITAEMLKVEVTDMFEINFIFPSDTTFHFELYQVSENQSLQELGTPEHIHIHCNSQVMRIVNDSVLNRLQILASSLYCLRLSWKTLNQFLKLWVKGSNLRLEYLFLQFPDNLGLDELFSGLKYQDAPPKRLRLFKTVCIKEPLKAYGGRDIWRFDGTQATISTDIRDDLVSFRMFVWHDHRVVN